MTIKEAIDFLFDIKTDVVYNITLDEKEAIEMGIEALEKQIPKKPVRGSEMYCDECGNVVKSYENYCDCCGQRLDWEEYRIKT